MKRCVPLKKECGREAPGYEVEVVLSQLRTSTHESKNMFVFFKSLRFYGEQESVSRVQPRKTRWGQF